MYQYQYEAELIRVKDGDTVEMRVFKDIDFGFKLKLRPSFELSFRFARVKCAEKDEPRGKEITQFVTDWFAKNGNKCTLHSEKPLKQEKFGRWLANIYAGDECLNDLLLQNGMAVPY